MGKSKFWQIYKKKQSNQIDWIIFFSFKSESRFYGIPHLV